MNTPVTLNSLVKLHPNVLALKSCLSILLCVITSCLPVFDRTPVAVKLCGEQMGL